MIGDAVMLADRLERPAGPELMTSQQVAERLSVSVRTLWRLVAAGKFPQPVRYNRKLVRWKTADVARYIETLC
jgi:excisionase family DNA binding protein